MENTSPKIRQISDEEIFSKNKTEYWLKFIIGFCFTIYFTFDFIYLFSQNYSCIESIEIRGVYKFIRECLIFIFGIYWLYNYGKILIKRKTSNIETKKIVMIFTFICALLILIPISLYFTLNIIKSSSTEKTTTNNDILLSNIPVEQETNIENTTKVEITNDDFNGDYPPCPEPRCGGVEVQNISVIASHTLENQNNNSYKASNLLDNNSNTAWATHFTGEIEILTFFMKADRLYKLSLVNGYNKNVSSFKNNSRAKDIAVYINGILDGEYELLGTEGHFPEYIILSKEYNNVNEVKIVISSVYEGDKWNDLCISDAYFFTKD